jgi:hypothetical protein
MRKTRFRGCSLVGRRQTRMDGVKVVMDMDLWDSVYINDIVGRPFCPCRVSPTVGFCPELGFPNAPQYEVSEWKKEM